MTQCTDVSAADEAANASASAFRCAPCASGFEGNGQTCAGVFLSFSAFRFISETSSSVFLSDINECLTQTVVAPKVCINIRGSFEIACDKGFLKVDDNCRDIDECLDGTAKCPLAAVCRNKPGNYSCECPSGELRPFHLHGATFLNKILFSRYRPHGQRMRGPQ